MHDRLGQLDSVPESERFMLSLEGDAWVDGQAFQGYFRQWERYLALVDDQLSLVPQKQQLILRKRSPGSPYHVSERIRRHPRMAIKLPIGYLQIMRFNFSGHAPALGDWEKFEFDIADDSNPAQPIVTIRNEAFRVFLHSREDGSIHGVNCVSGNHEKFRIGLTSMKATACLCSVLGSKASSRDATSA